MTKKYCWVWNVKKECLEEYVKMHRNPWPEIMKAHVDAGFKDYSIFQNGTQFIYTFDCDGDPMEAFAKMTDNEDCKRWNALTGPMLDVDLKGGDVDAGVVLLKEIFRLD